MDTRIDMVWKAGPDQLAIRLEDYWQMVERRLESELKIVGQLMVLYAQEVHPWKNRTGDAERNLSYELTVSGATFSLVLSHGVDYGIYLERRWAGRWGVIPKATAFAYPLAMRAAQNAMQGG